MLIKEKVVFFKDQERSEESYSNGEKNNSHRSIFKISLYDYGSDAKKLIYLSKLKNE